MISPIDRRNFMAIAALLASSAALPASAEEQAKGGHEQSMMKLRPMRRKSPCLSIPGWWRLT
ncbi:MAG TPA: hypothetical protein VL202_20965 [Pararhizobium sp.]|uniref:hypothetical protein n=1 Tax=Pararhizobium sp. TaxID=1977563 RepID=UPI002CDAA611|nr:hypothetical protein [Pararhizobium sp.]HTO33619.1 hypothetical protein [Pararhizobium sp.]